MPLLLDDLLCFHGCSQIDRANAYIQEQQNRVTTFVEEGRASARAHVAASSQRIVTAAHAHSQTLRSGFSTLTATIPASVQLPGGSVSVFIIVFF